MKKVSVMILALAFLFTLAACGNNEGTGGGADSKLQEYIDIQKADLDAVIESLGDTMNLTVTAENTTLVYTYTYLIDVDEDLAKTTFGEQESTLKDTADTVILPEMKEYGIKNPQVKYIYLSKDGTELYSAVFK